MVTLSDWRRRTCLNESHRDPSASGLPIWLFPERGRPNKPEANADASRPGINAYADRDAFTDADTQFISLGKPLTRSDGHGLCGIASASCSSDLMAVAHHRYTHGAAGGLRRRRKHHRLARPA